MKVSIRWELSRLPSLTPLAKLSISAHVPNVLNRPAPCDTCIRLLSSGVQPAKPKARQEQESDRRKNAAQKWAALGLGGFVVVAGIAMLASARSQTVPELLQELVEAVRSAGQPDAEQISGVLPPWGVYSDPERGHEGRAIGPVILRAPTATVVLGWEGTCVDVVYDPKAGYIPIPRPGFIEFLLSCADADVEVVLWSSAASAVTVQEQLAKIVTGLVAQQDADRYADFRRFLLDTYERSKAMEAARAAQEGRAPRPVMPITEADVPGHYTTSVLRVAATVGKELCHRTGSGQLGRDIELLTSGRRPGDVMVVLREDEAGSTTLPTGATMMAVPPFPKPTDKGAAVTKEVKDDPMFMLLGQLLQRFSEERGAAMAASEAGAGQGHAKASAGSASQGSSADAVPKPPRFDIRSFVSGLETRAMQRKLRPSTGRAVDSTVGVLGQLMNEERQAMKGKGR